MGEWRPMTIQEARRAVRLADELKNLREAIEALKEDRSRVVHVKVEDLTRTYGSDRQRIVFPYEKARLLDVLDAEVARITLALIELGVTPEPQEADRGE